MLKIAKLLLVNTAVLVAFSVVLEVGYRAYHVVFNDESFFREERFISPWITTYDYPPPRLDDAGRAFFRHETEPTAPGPRTDGLRVIAVGGSTTANLHAHRIDGIDWATALEGKLAARLAGAPVEVLNAGADAYSTVHSLINLELRLVAFAPDAILLMHNLNDSSVNTFAGGATSDYGNKYLQPYYLAPSLQAGRSFVGLITQSRLLSALRVPELAAGRSGHLDPTNDYAPGLALFERNLATISAVCRLHGIRLVLLSQPRSRDVHFYVSAESFDAYNQAVAAVARRRGDVFVDMFERLGHDERYFIDTVHYSPEGIQRFAELLADDLAPVLTTLPSRS